MYQELRRQRLYNTVLSLKELKFTGDIDIQSNHSKYNMQRKDAVRTNVL